MSDSLRKHLSDLHIAIEKRKDNEGNLLINDIKVIVKRYKTMPELGKFCTYSSIDATSSEI